MTKANCFTSLFTIALMLIASIEAAKFKSCSQISTEARDGAIRVKGAIKAANGQSLSAAQARDWNVKVTFKKGEVNYPATIGDGFYTIDLAEGTYSRFVSQDGATEQVEQGFVFEQSCDETEPSNTVNVPDANEILIEGYIKDATTGQIIPADKLAQLTLKFKKGDHEYAATLISGSKYQVKLPRGTYDRTAQLPEHIVSTLQFNVVRPSGAENNDNTLLLSPKFRGWRFVLTWGGNKIKDLDAHLIVPDKSHVYHLDPVSKDGKAKVDTDSKNYSGPETITIVPTLQQGTYKFFAHNYSAESKISDAQGKVVVYHDDNVEAEIFMPTSQENPASPYWGVARLVRDADGKETLTVTNKIVDKTNQF
jgi:hypothetical protein